MEWSQVFGILGECPIVCLSHHTTGEGTGRSRIAAIGTFWWNMERLFFSFNRLQTRKIGSGAFFVDGFGLTGFGSVDTTYIFPTFIEFIQF